MITKKYSEYINENFGQADEAYGTFFVSLLGLRDQAHIFHWQTKSYARHMAFGDFYDTFIEATDVLAEMIMGIKGRPTMGMSASISLKDYSEENVTEFIKQSYDLLGAQLEMICNSTENEEVFDQARIIVAEVDKLKYLLTLD
jgi:DNA-binding ferritin-like protein